MYNLAPRMGKPIKPQTSEHIAPNTYTICYGRDLRKNRAPFLSCAPRKPSFGNPLYCDAIYDYETRSRIAGGASVKYTAERKTIVLNRTPGPGDYEPMEETKKCKKTPREIKGKGRLYACRVPYTIEFSAPSIPTEVNQNGYEILNGKIKPVPPDDNDTTLGPAYYCVPFGEVNGNSRRYKGCKWSCHTARRDVSLIDDNPGPGTYDVLGSKQCRRNDEDEDFRSMARFLSYVPRFSDEQALKACKEDLPGPAEYTIRDHFACDPGLWCIEPRPFISGAERFTSKVDDSIPAANTYAISSEVYKKKNFSTSCVPFAVGDERFASKQINGLPGPGTYDVKDFVTENLIKIKNAYSVKKVPFASTAERDTMNIGDAMCIPGPGQYDNDKKERKEGKCSSSVFKSKSLRFGSMCSEDAGPAKYNVSDIYKKMQDRKSFHAVEVPFLTTSIRLKDASNEVPGVGEYVLPIGTSNPRRISEVPRPCMQSNNNPPPGSYEVDSVHTSCIEKALSTHNLRLKEEILRKKLRRAPKETREQWIKMLKKKKVLHWFAVPHPVTD